MFEVGNIIGWADGSFAILVLSIPNEKREFKGLIISSKFKDYKVGTIEDNWYTGSYAGSTEWVKMKVEIC